MTCENPKIDYDTIFQCMVQGGMTKVIFTTDSVKNDNRMVAKCKATFYNDKGVIGFRELVEDIKLD